MVLCLRFHIPPIFGVSTLKWLIFIVIWYHIVSILTLWWFHFVWLGIFHCSHDIFHHYLEFGNICLMFLICFIVIINCSLYSEELIIHKFSSCPIHLILHIFIGKVYSHINMLFVMKSCFYLAQVSVDIIITWWNQCVQNIIFIE